MPRRCARRWSTAVSPRAELGTDRGEFLVPLGGEDAAAALLTSLVRAGVAISSFTPAVGDLEHTFLDLSRDARQREARA